MIPKIIHYVWVGDPNKKSKLFYKCLESWKKFCPDWEIKEWNESNFDINQSIYAKEAYSLKKYGFVPDYIRAKVLYDYGGIYLDTDVEITKPLDDLLDNDFLISFENEVHLETAVLGSCKNHPFAKIMSDFYTQYPYVYNNKPDLTPSTPIWTILLQKHYGLKLKNTYQKLELLDRYKNQVTDKTKNMTVTALPNEYFCPLNYTTKELKTTDNTYAIHYFDASWFSKSLTTREKFLKEVYKTFGKKIFSLFTKCYVSSVKRKLKKRFKKYKIKLFD